jgi:hypothetical protein
MQTPEALDELEKDAECERKFIESATGPLIYAKIVVAVVSVIFFHEGVSNIGN